MKKIISVLVAIPVVLLLLVSFSFAADVSDLFGPDSYFHPFISIDQSWSDNIYKTENNKVDDYWVTTKPGIWLALPGSSLFMPPVEEMGRVQAFLSYNADIKNISGENDHDDIDHNLEGHVLYNGAGGLSVKLSDVYKDKHDDIVEGSDNIHYADNTLSTDIRYEITEKTAITLGYTHFTENYDKVKNSQDRKENLIESAVYYGLMPKTAVFLQFAYKDITYKNYPIQDNKEIEYLTGIKWDITDRTTGSFKLGYLNKAFKSSLISDKSIMKIVLDAGYEITLKSDITLTAKNETNETDELAAAYFETSSLLTTYRHELSERFTGFFSLFYNIEDYNIDRKDTMFSIAPSLTYKFNDLFTCDFAYTYEDVESKGIASADTYTANILLLTVSVSM